MPLTRLAYQKQDIVATSVNTKMHLEIYKLAISFREEFMASKNLIGEKFMIPCKNIHPCPMDLLAKLSDRIHHIRVYNLTKLSTMHWA